MALDTTARRRWFGAVILLVALAMLVGGETVFKERLGPIASLLYWMACLILTSLAIMVALLDVRALQRRTRQEQRDLLDATLKNIETQGKARPHPPGQPRRGA